jgi:hypothetical protein
MRPKPPYAELQYIGKRLGNQKFIRKGYTMSLKQFDIAGKVAIVTGSA